MTSKGAFVSIVPQSTPIPTSGVTNIFFSIWPRLALLAAKLCNEINIPLLIVPDLGTLIALYP
jgi:hypothetical protein